MLKISHQIIECFRKGKKVLIIGNGGSMAESSHLAAEFIGIGLPAFALNDPACLTALINDYNPLNVFKHYIAATGKNGDVLITLSTTGKSRNVLRAIKVAKVLGLEVIDFPRTGKDTGDIQEKQLNLIHRVFLEIKEGMDEDFIHSTF